MIRKLFALVLFMLCTSVLAATKPYVPQKREFRGAWIQCVNG